LQSQTRRGSPKDIPAEWLGEAFIAEAERLEAVNEQAYRHEYLGEATGTGAEVFPALEVREITAEEVQNMQYFFSGVDFGFAADPACFIRCSYDRKHETIYILNEIYKRGMSNRQLAEEIAPLVEGDTKGSSYLSPVSGLCFQDHSDIYCDAAEPKSIADLRDHGLKQARACHKEPGCVAYRVKWLQHRRIVVDPARTPNAARELANYEYEKDKDGNMLSSLPDRDNHSIDSLAYALDREIYRKRGQSA
jgi:phage terminase large subunit